MLKRRLLGLALLATFLVMPACVFAIGGDDDGASASYKRSNIEQRVDALERRVEAIESQQGGVGAIESQHD